MVERIDPYDDRRVVGSHPAAVDRERVVERDERVVDRDEVLVQEKNTPSFSLGGTFLGWCVASFLTAVFLALAGAILGGVGFQATDQGLTTGEAQQLGVAAAIGSLVAIFLGYLFGGYTAGRIGLWRGVAHGAMVPVWTILFAILLALLAGAYGPAALETAGIQPPNLAFGEFTGEAILAIVLTLAAMFGGAILGGVWGARYGRGEAEVVRRRATRRAGRPL